MNAQNTQKTHQPHVVFNKFMPEILARTTNELHFHDECGRFIRFKHLRKNHYCTNARSVHIRAHFSASSLVRHVRMCPNSISTLVQQTYFLCFFSVITLTASTISLRAERQKYASVSVMERSLYVSRLLKVKQNEIQICCICIYEFTNMQFRISFSICYSMLCAHFFLSVLLYLAVHITYILLLSAVCGCDRVVLVSESFMVDGDDGVATSCLPSLSFHQQILCILFTFSYELHFD